MTQNIDKNIFRDISYGMYVVTSIDNSKNKVGCIINTLTQITSSEPMISISLNKENYTNSALKDSKKFSVSILSTDTSKKMIGTFGYYTSNERDKFKNISYEEVENLPVVKENICGYLIAEVAEIIDCNTHNLIIAKVIIAKKEKNLTPMTYAYYHENLKGESPKKAPTYIEKVAEEQSNSSKYRCTICGYIYDESIEELKFEELPEDWKCPLCGAPKHLFEKIK